MKEAWGTAYRNHTRWKNRSSTTVSGRYRRWGTFGCNYPECLSCAGLRNSLNTDICFSTRLEGIGLEIKQQKEELASSTFPVVCALGTITLTWFLLSSSTRFNSLGRLSGYLVKNSGVAQLPPSLWDSLYGDQVLDQGHKISTWDIDTTKDGSGFR